ncbi:MULTISPECIES: putative urea ABC transporter substrate-binding protein [Methylophaga]|uniref:Alkanesulfonate transporter substrate-binding subunit n=1 Tax=Methylophaga muralis TaxID=291169 RepID=A0A1E3GV37_9GAMM|nr:MULTISPECIES: putative urea ABC transporter substrate-binding protein [Methylophaga]ODN67416.1 alkanesulfonate transporter substrate-binding subunit [Methylophaga muralis]THK40906.1 lipid kinase [Methylophaga sp. SB9B]
MKHSFFRICSVLLLSFSALLSPLSAHAETKDKFSIAWTIYAGWMPWDYADNAGIVKKWADKYDIEIDVVQINDYIESINQYTAGQFDGCTMTNMDALTIPAAGGVDSTALIIGDFSNGNDGIVLKGSDKTLADIKGQRVNLVELSVSHYLLARALDSVKMSERDVTVVNTSDADLVGVFNAADVTSTVTWNPLLSEITAVPNTTKVFDSSDIPGEIIDMLVVNTETLEANPAFGKALTGAWYEIMAKMQAGDEEALTMMAEASGTDLAGYKAQLDATNMFYTAAEAVSFTESEQLQSTMKHITDFSFDHGLLGDGAMNADFIGIAYPNGEVAGDTNNVKLRFDSSFMKMAADNAL